MWYRGRTSRLTEAIALRDQLTSSNTSCSSGQQPHQPQFPDLRRAVDQLSPNERRKFWADRRRQFRDWLDDFFRAPPREQAAVLDSEIRRMREFRERETAHSADGQGPTWTNGLSQEDLLLRERIWLDLTTPEERAQVDTYLQMLSQQGQSGGQPGLRSPWGNCPS
jgi:hypothetical protein